MSQVVAILLKAGADVNAVRYDGHVQLTPLGAAQYIVCSAESYFQKLIAFVEESLALFCARAPRFSQGMPRTPGLLFSETLKSKEGVVKTKITMMPPCALLTPGRSLCISGPSSPPVASRATI